jgi:twinkle protein
MLSIVEYLQNKGFEYRKRRDEAIMNCPFCDDKDRKFAINLKNGVYNCMHLNNCGVRGSFYDFQKRLGDRPERTEPKFSFIQKQKTYKLPIPKMQDISSPVVEYLKSRGLTEETIKAFDVKTKDGAAAFPYYRDGVVTNVKYMALKRDPITGRKKMWSEEGAEPTLFNRDNILGNELTICEGEIDCMTLVQYGIDAVSVPMGAGNFDWVDREWDFINLFKKINICFDNDEIGLKSVNELIQKIGSWRSYIVTLPYKDANECLCNGVEPDTMTRCFLNARDYVPAMLANPSDFSEKIHALFENPGSLNGKLTPWAGLNKILRGWRTEELTVWTGRNGSGKSTILNQVVLGMAEELEKFCIASLEMPPERYLRWAIIQYSKNVSPHRTRIDNILAWFDYKIFIINNYEALAPKDLLETFEYAARRHSVKHFLIDSLMKIKLPGKDEYAAQTEFISDLVSFTKKFSCHIHLVCHPRKGSSDSDVPGKVDVSGSGNITNLAHNVISMWRPDSEIIEKAKAAQQQGSTPDMVMRVCKNREFGTEGKIRMWFDVNTKIFRDQYEEEK